MVSGENILLYKQSKLDESKGQKMLLNIWKHITNEMGTLEQGLDKREVDITRIPDENETE